MFIPLWSRTLLDISHPIGQVFPLLMLSQSLPPPHSSWAQGLTFVLVPLLGQLWHPDINENMWYSLFYVSFILLKSVSSISIHVAANDETSLCYDGIIMCRDIKNSFIYQRALGTFCVLTILNNSTVSIWIQESLWHACFISIGCIRTQELVLLDYLGVCF